MAEFWDKDFGPSSLLEDLENLLSMLEEANGTDLSRADDPSIDLEYELKLLNNIISKYKKNKD